MKKNLLTLLLLSLIALNSAFAQGRKITGSVTGADDGLPLPGVTVKVTGTTVGTQTDAQGLYTLTVPATAKSLTFSYIGYVALVSNITGTTVNVKLVSDNKALSEVVVTGYGVQSKREITSSVSSIKGSDFADQPVQSFDRAIQGRAAGVQVTSGSGQPGSAMQIVIRGVATVNGTTAPLYIVDGIQLNSGGVSGITSVDALSSINPDDIESIEILKDAASAAIYGALAANGVVLVTTKRGKVGKTQINASFQYGTTKAYNPYQTLSSNDWFTLRKEAYRNQAIRTGTATAATATDATANSTISVLYPGGVVPTDLPYYDWVKAILQTGKVAQYDLSLNGGDTKTQFFISGSYNATDGSIVNSNFKRGTLRGNLTHNVTDKFSVTSSFSLTGSRAGGPTTQQGLFVNGAFTGTVIQSPVNPIYNADGTYNQILTGRSSTNEVQYNAQEETSTGIFQTVDNLAMTYKFVPELSFKAFGGLDFSDIRDFDYRPSTLSGNPTGAGSESFRRNINYNISGTFNFNKKFGDHNLSAIAGVEYRSVLQTVLSASATGFPSPAFDLLSNASTPATVGSTFTGYRVAGVLGNLSYKYKDKYFLTLNGRNDGSSRFGANHKFGLFYGGSIGWDMTKEDFMQGLTFISQLKPRFSYGVVGELPTANFGSIAQYGGSGVYQYNTSAIANSFPGGVIGGLAPTGLPVPDLTWERSTQPDLGLDFAFLNNRINGSIDFYRKTNSDLILNFQLAGDTGFTGINQNAGSAKSEGYDFQLNTVNIDKWGLRWNTTLNVGYNRTQLLSLYNGVQQISSFLYTVGSPLQSVYTQQWAGVNPADGRQMFYDINGNITYAPKAGVDQRIIGHYLPTWTGGFSNTISYKGVTLDCLFQYQYGNLSLLSIQQNSVELSGSIADNQTVNQLMRWTTPGQITSVPRPYNGLVEPGGVSIQTGSSRWFDDASYIRLKQISLTYQLPASISKKIGIPTVSVFAQAYNLATFTNYRGDDPEQTSSGSNLNAYPNPKSVTFGIKAKF